LSLLHATASTAIYTLSLHDALPIFDRLQREDARVRSGADLVADSRGVEAVAHEVVLGRGVELDRAVGAVVVGRHQALRRDEARRSEEHTSELQSRENLVCRLLLEKK